MSHPVPYFREAGSGPGVVCLHSNASTSNQWRALMESLAPKYHMLAPDSYGAGKSPSWPTDRTVMLRDEAAFLEPVFVLAGEPFAFVGHSYGAAIALISALQQPRRVRAMALYEPTLFSVLDAQSPHETAGIRATVAAAAAALDEGDTARAAEHFIDYWMWPGAWAAMPESRKPAVAASMVNVLGWGNALMNEPTPLQAFALLDIPVLYMVGKQSPVSSRGVARLLTRTLPRVEVLEFDDLGHMGPVTHPDMVNEAILRFLDAVRI